MKGVQDSIGFTECIPGPCGLFRSDRLGNLSEGMAKKYFECIKAPTKDLVFGNVKLAEGKEIEEEVDSSILSSPCSINAHDITITSSSFSSIPKIVFQATS